MIDKSYTRFKEFLNVLGYKDGELPQKKFSHFCYAVHLNQDRTDSEQLQVDYFYFSSTEELFRTHLSIWNQNNRNSFVAVFDDKSYIIDTRQKPEMSSPLSKKAVITSFEYGVNTEGFDEISLNIISKSGVNSSYYFDFVIKQQQKRKTSEVDKDLLINLLALRNDLVNSNNHSLIHLLILRCLFVKYLEDRNVFQQDFLLSALEEQSASKLIKVFREVRKINGDLFKFNEFDVDDLKPQYLKKLSQFFGYYDYQSSQGRFFPYQFDKIPIQLISNIYESFLKQETKKERGIYYTPSFLVNFMLGQTLATVAEKKKDATILDPACGSGAFLVEAFKLLIRANKAEGNFDLKKYLLQNQVFGIDLDPRALQIAAFSLYLALLEGENSDFIQEKMRIESPILPPLIGRNLLNKNALTDKIEFKLNERKLDHFTCILANPPWGSVSSDELEDAENIKLRAAIGNKAMPGTMPIYESVSDFQRSQAFVLRAQEWCSSETIISMVVNNSIFHNENARSFRNDFLKNFRLLKFYELSGINSILFKKKKIGQIRNENIEIGANEPCSVLVFKPANSIKELDNNVSYVSPKLNKYIENLHIITYSSKDVKTVKQTDLIKEDLLWRIFVNGGWPDYHLIKQRMLKASKTISIECRTGFQPKVGMKKLGAPIWKQLLKANNLVRYAHLGKTTKFNWNQELHRRREESIFEGERILVPERTLTSDEYRFRATRVDSKKIVHTDDILCIKIKVNGQYIEDYKPYLAIINSKFIGYCFYHISTQWGKGTTKRSTLRNSDIESLPIPDIDLNSKIVKELSSLVKKVEELKIRGIDTSEFENLIDEKVFDLYDLTAYERALINEFFQIKLYRLGEIVNKIDIDQYAKRFINVFSSVLKSNSHLNYKPVVSANFGAAIKFYFETSSQNNTDFTFDILNLVKEKQISSAYLSNALAEEKTKIYKKEEGAFYVIKSHYFKDWTLRSAIDDANEEVESMLKYYR